MSLWTFFIHVIAVIFHKKWLNKVFVDFKGFSIVFNPLFVTVRRTKVKNLLFKAEFFGKWVIKDSCRIGQQATRVSTIRLFIWVIWLSGDFVWWLLFTAFHFWEVQFELFSVLGSWLVLLVTFLRDLEFFWCNFFLEFWICEAFLIGCVDLRVLQIWFEDVLVFEMG